MIPRKTEDQKCLVLNVKEGNGFGYLKNSLLKVVPKFENKRLVSDYVYPSPQPAFNFTFIWTVTENFLQSLQKSRSCIRIEIWATKSQENWRVGYAVLGVQHAQFATRIDTLPYRRLPLRSAKTKFGLATPELFVTLSIQNGSQFSTNNKIYSTGLLGYVKSRKQPIRSKITTVTPKRKLQKFSETQTSSKRSTASVNKNHLLSEKCTKRPSTTASVTNGKLSQRAVAQPVLDKGATVANETFDDGEAHRTSLLTADKDEGNKFTPFHHYMLEILFGTVEWYAAIKNIRISVRFYNPLDNNLVTGVKDEDMNMMDLLLSYLMCRMYYVCIPENLLKTVMYYPPHVAICKANSNRIIAKGAVKIKHLKLHKKAEHFQSYIPLVSKHKKIVGKLPVFITFQDLGILATLKHIGLTECFVKYSNTNANEESKQKNDIINDLEKLSKVCDKLKNTQNKIDAGFHQIMQNHITQHISKHKRFIQRADSQKELYNTCNWSHEVTKIDNFIVAVDTHNSKKTKHQQHKYNSAQINKPSITVNKNEKDKQVSFATLPIQTKKKSKIRQKPQQIVEDSLHSVNIVKYCCKGCSQYLDIGLGTNVWQNDEQVFWCKDCKIKKYQSEVTQTVSNYSSEMSELKNHMDKLEAEYKKQVADCINEDKYEQLVMAQHNLTFLFFHSNIQNEQLLTKYFEIVEELKNLKQNNSVIQTKEIFSRTALKQEIDQYKYENNLTLKIQNDYKHMDKSHENLQNSDIKSITRKNRCEACKILRQRSSSVSEHLPCTYKSKNKINLPEVVEDTKTNKPDDSYIHHVSAKMHSIHVKLQMYLEVRDELIRINQYTCNSPLIIYMTHTIQYLLAAWFNLKIELENKVKH